MAAGLLALLGPGPAAMARAEDPGQVTKVLRERLDQLQKTGRIEAGGAEIASRRALPVLYQQNGYKPFWTPDRLDVLLELVRKSDEDGLRPEDYHEAALAKLAPALKAAGVDAATRAQGDLLATDAFVLLLYHLYLGKVDPKGLDPQWNFQLRPVGDPAALPVVRDALMQGKLKETVAKVRPDHWWYERARAALARYRAIAARGGWAPVPAGKKLQPGMKDARVPALRKRLAATGELSGQPLDSENFDEPVAAAVKEFQARHRLTPDGAIGPGTLAELNVPVEARILQIRINLERARWVLHEIKPGDLVIVDVAGFDVSFARDQKVLWSAKVQIGKPYRKTPIFKSMIDNVVFNPTWTVPPGIIAKDVLPAIKRDPGYLEKKKLDVIDRSGKKVDPSSIDWSKQSADNFPYMVRQEAGPDNALGRVKINFPNPYFVYLHDTSAQGVLREGGARVQLRLHPRRAAARARGIAPERSTEMERRHHREGHRGRRDADRPAAEAGAGAADVLDDRPRDRGPGRLQARSLRPRPAARASPGRPVHPRTALRPLTNPQLPHATVESPVAET